MTERIRSLLLLIALSTLLPQITNAVFYKPNALLNGYSHADKDVLGSMVAGNSYFIEFPTDLQYLLPSTGVLPPMCGDRSNFSFLFRKGSPQHFRKLIVEFEGGPACWGTDCRCDAGLRQVPWKDYAESYDDSDDQALPRLGSCNGVVPEFVSELTSSLFGNTTAFDIPIMARSGNSGNDNNANDHWWNKIDDNMKDWSYILIPHCTLDWHLGYARQAHLTGCASDISRNTEFLMHRGAANRDVVLAWVVQQFGNEQISLEDYYLNRLPPNGTGLQGLVTVAGGKMGGCNANNNDPQEASASVASAIFTNRAASYFKTMQSALVLLEGASLFSPNMPANQDFTVTLEAVDLPFANLPYDLKFFVERAPASVHHIWVSSKGSGNLNTGLEAQLVRDMEGSKGDTFHRFMLDSVDIPVADCPTYAFPHHDGDGNLEPFGRFLEQVVQQLSWTYVDGSSYSSSTATSDASSSSSFGQVLSGSDDSDETANGDVTLRLSWLAIAVILVGTAAFVYVVYFLLRYYRHAKNKAPPMGPYQLWLYTLTHYPRCFLLVSLAIPCFLSWLAFSRAGYTVNINLDFQTYLAISSSVSIVADNYDGAVTFQETSDREADVICNALGDWGIYKQNNRRSLAWMEEDEALASFQSAMTDANSTMGRQLQGGPVFQDQGPDLYRTTVQVFYQNRNGGNVFTPQVLEELFQFEQDVRDYKGYDFFCRRLTNGSCRFGTPLSWLYDENGILVNDIEGTLAEKATPEKVDQYFSIPNNLASNMTKSFIYFEGEKSAVNSFLKGFYEDFLKKRDQDFHYPNLVFSWENGFLLQQEANEALLHDTLWSVGSLVVIGIMIYLKVQDFFVFFFGMAGLILAFTTSYYWCTAHFGIPEITLLHISGLFVMLGIGADDIFLMTDSYAHAKVGMTEEDDGSNTQNQADDSSVVESSADPDGNGKEEERVEKIRKQMLWAYSTAGGMMLVSSMTAAVCFFSNAFGVLLVIQDFGIYMGMVVLINFFHVMTILPSAILVNEIYFKPFCCCCCSDEKTADDDVPDNDPNKSGHDVEDNLNRQTSTEESRHRQGNGNPAEEIETSSMGLMDRVLYNSYAPFLVRQRIPILVLSILFAVIIGSIGLANLEFTDGSIIVFSNEYNQGRLSSIKNAYYSQVDPSLLSLGGSIGSGGGTGGSGGGTGGGTGGGIPGGIPDSNPGTGGNGGSAGGGGGSGGDGGTTGGTGGTGGGTNGGGTGTGGGAPVITPTRVPTAAPTRTPNAGGTGDNGPGSNGGGTGSSGGNGGGGNTNGGGTGTGGGTPVSAPTLRPTAPPVNTGNETTTALAEETSVKLLWGIDTQSADTTGLWRVKSSTKKIDEDEKSLLAGVSGFDVTEPANQQWLLEVVLAARATDSLNAVSSEPTWIEMLADFASKQKDGGFPIQKELFTSYVEILKFKDPAFDEIVKDEIGTSLPGLAGQPLYASVTFQSRASSSLGSFTLWTDFADAMNEKSPSSIPPMVAQSDLFWNSARAQETIDATVNTWLLANLLCFAIILIFTQNLLLSGMVIGTIILMFMCIAGWLFAVLDRSLGPIQALGVSIFIGLSANYSLHVVHAYHRSKSANREAKVKQAVFITGSPICASAISTIGGCVFLFGCRAIPLVELGILICCVTAMALLYSMGFLLTWLLVMGPLPDETGRDTGGRKLHRWDIFWLCHTLPRRFMTRSSGSESRTTPVQKLRTGASSVLSTLKENLEGKFSKQSSQLDETNDAERDNTRSIPTFPSSASNLSSDNAPIQNDDPVNISSDPMSGQAFAQTASYPSENAATAPILYQPGPYIAGAPSNLQMGAQPGEPTSGYGVPTAPSSPFSAPIQRYDPMSGQAFAQTARYPSENAATAPILYQPGPYIAGAPANMQMGAQPGEPTSGYGVPTAPSSPFSAPIQSHDPMSGQAFAPTARYQSDSAAAAPSLYQSDAHEDLRQQQVNIAREPTSMQDPPRGYGVSTASSVPFSASAPPTYPERMGMNAHQNDYPYDIRGAPPMSHNYVQNENPRSVQGYAPGEPISREHSAAHRNGLENTAVEPVSAQLLYPRAQLLNENQATAANSSQMSSNQMPLANYPRSIQSNKEEDSNDNWDLSSILSYFSGTERADTTTTEPASMLVLGPQDDQSVASELAMDPFDHPHFSMLSSPYLHATDMGDAGSEPSDEGSAPFDEM